MGLTVETEQSIHKVCYIITDSELMGVYFKIQLFIVDTDFIEESTAAEERNPPSILLFNGGSGIGLSQQRNGREGSV